MIIHKRKQTDGARLSRGVVCGYQVKGVGLFGYNRTTNDEWDKVTCRECLRKKI
jgi:hypothetical protein